MWGRVVGLMARRLTKKRVAYLRRKDGLIQRYRVNTGKVFDNEVTRRDYLAQRQELRTIRLERARIRRRRVTSGAPVREGTVPAHLLRHFTLFKAEGISPQDGGGRQPTKFKSEYIEDNRPPPGMATGPRNFVSQSALGGIGQVKFKGVRTEKSLIEELNDTLNIEDFKGRPQDFRQVYSYWSYRYLVIEELRTGGGKRTLIEVMADSKGGRRQII